MTTEVIMCLAVFALMVLDIITGFLNAVKDGTVSSSVMREGLFHKFGSIVIVMLGMGIQYAGMYIGMDATVCACAGTGICGMVGVMEVVSVVENACRLNPELPIARIFAIIGVDAEKEQ